VVKDSSEANRAAERRDSLRTPTTLRGKVFPGRLDCIITDYSQTGARLRFSGRPPEGDDIVVVIWSTGIALEAKRCWREGAEAGCLYLRRFDLRGTVPHRLAEVKAQWQNRRPKLRRSQLRDSGVMINYRGSPRAVQLS
jgi:hypothetical protein